MTDFQRFSIKRLSLPVDLERRQPRADAGVLRPVRPQHGRVVGEESDDVGAEDVAAPEGVGDVAVAENVLGLTVPLLFAADDGGAAVEEAPVEARRVVGVLQLVVHLVCDDKAVIVDLGRNIMLYKVIRLV